MSAEKEEQDDDEQSDASAGKGGRPLYTGKWTDQEEAYVQALIHEFRSGILPNLEEGTSLRLFLAEKLDCKPKRISKKYERSGM
jgi:hypothetical protein